MVRAMFGYAQPYEKSKESYPIGFGFFVLF